MTTLITRKISAAVAAAGLALLATACGSSSASAPAASASAPAVAQPSAAAAAAIAVLKTDATSLGMVLANAKGFTVYWFAKDTPTSSACTGACAAAWPPVLGMPQLAAGVKLTGKLGEIKRPGGAMQATYNGHPLYLFAGDSGPGMTSGNGVNGFGALWYAIKIGTSTTASTSGTGTSVTGTSVTGTSVTGSGVTGSGGTGSGGTGSGGMGGSGGGW